MKSENIEEFIRRYPEYLDEVAEANDQLGTLQGVAFTNEHVHDMPHGDPMLASLRQMGVVQLVFDHGIVTVRRDNLKCVSIRTMVRIDETTPLKELEPEE